MEVKIIGQMDNTIDNTYESANRIYDKKGLAPTINTCSGGGLQPKVIVQKARGFNSGNIYDVCTSITSHAWQENNFLYNQYKVRKLTPKECWRLMDFSDEDFEKAEKVNSNTQLYKQAGNSIVVNVLVAILGQILPGKENVYKNKI